MARSRGLRTNRFIRADDGISPPIVPLPEDEAITRRLRAVRAEIVAAMKRATTVKRAARVDRARPATKPGEGAS